MSDGYFPQGKSMLRRVHEEKAVGLFYGQRALCVGAAKPLNYVGTSRHTRNKSMPFRRISHTGEMFEAVFFGTRAEADRVLEAVRRSCRAGWRAARASRSSGWSRRPSGGGSRGENPPRGSPIDAGADRMRAWAGDRDLQEPITSAKMSSASRWNV
jgi:hypothetical protein